MTAEALRKKGNYNGFDPVILSYEVKMAKPDSEIYQLAVDELNVMPEEIIFVDDQEKCWPPAEELGMKVVKADSPEQIVKDIKTMILAENNLRI